MRTRIFFDMDGTLAEWKCIQFQISSEEGFVNVEEKIYEILRRDGYYYNLKPYMEMVKAVNRLLKMTNVAEVYILTCYIPDCQAQLDKLRWIRRYLPVFPEDHILMVKDGEPKSMALEDLRPTDILVDDFTRNLLSWHGIGIKALNGINDTHKTFRGMRIRVDENPDKIVNQVLYAARNTEKRVENA